jgi:hypothetical protein
MEGVDNLVISLVLFEVVDGGSLLSEVYLYHTVVSWRAYVPSFTL